jgi:shikimate kinase
MRSGKTTVGRLLAARLAVPFVDNDDVLLRQTGRTARAIAAAAGLDALHRAEASALAAALAAPSRSVIAAAASSILEPGAVARLAGHDVVYLSVPPEELDRRERAAPDLHRPEVSYSPERDARYRSVATVCVDTAGKTPGDVADEIIAAIGR